MLRLAGATTLRALSRARAGVAGRAGTLSWRRLVIDTRDGRHASSRCGDGAASAQAAVVLDVPGPLARAAASPGSSRWPRRASAWPTSGASAWAPDRAASRASGSGSPPPRRSPAPAPAARRAGDRRGTLPPGRRATPTTRRSCCPAGARDHYLALPGDDPVLVPPDATCSRDSSAAGRGRRGRGRGRRLVAALRAVAAAHGQPDPLELGRPRARACRARCWGMLRYPLAAAAATDAATLVPRYVALPRGIPAAPLRRPTRWTRSMPGRGHGRPASAEPARSTP